MIWILATRGASTKLRQTPFTETAIEGVFSAVYKPGVEPIPFSGGDTGEGQLGTYSRGANRASGFVFSYDGSAAETLFGITDEIDLIVRYQANGQLRKKTFSDILFVGDSTVTLPGLNSGVAELIGVPFRIQIPTGSTLLDHIIDESDS